jgi:hypothetical protein
MYLHFEDYTMSEITHRIYLGSKELGRIEQVTINLYVAIAYKDTELQEHFLKYYTTAYSGEGGYQIQRRHCEALISLLSKNYQVTPVAECEAYLQSLQPATVTDEDTKTGAIAAAPKPDKGKSILTHWLYDASKQVGTIYYTEENVFLVSWLEGAHLINKDWYRDLKLNDVVTLSRWLCSDISPLYVTTPEFTVLRDGLEQGLQPDFEQFELTSIPVQQGKHSEPKHDDYESNPDFKIYKDGKRIGTVELGKEMNQIYLSDERAIALMQSSGYEDFIVEDHWTKFDTLYFRTALQLLSANGFTISEWLNAPIESEQSEAVDNSKKTSILDVYTDNELANPLLEHYDPFLAKLESLIDKLKQLPNWALDRIASDLNDEYQRRQDDAVSCLETIAADMLPSTPSYTCEL